ncbi:LacI family transcriptional regulator [Ktedonosporobacter rubrisoli]|uniref:LacI family transcriptional regulator n=1 Tax=Ktedonosporobacter rubrisoli TaxID=2509675 RepID=A0A4V0Z0E5_KTERU|nr:LacI family DNA-binding transcriptional regulator [Ktedonosporobacter rubrisoli]QBD82941.1 LacI family transcriptional regulator [Ktedonosporobacter rubrisoli]
MSSELDNEQELPQQHAVTIHDVARAAGVTIGTVSKALNGQGKLKEETRERVRAVALRLGFRPNDLAQSLLRGRSFTVGLITTDSYGRFSIPLMSGIEDALGSAQISVFLCDARDDAVREQQHINSLLAKRVDGIIVTGRRIDARVPIDVGNTNTPVLYAYAQVKEADALCLLPDEAQGARIATEHLLAHGRRRLAHITGPSYFEAVQLRQEAMRQVLKEHGLDLPGHRALAGPWQEAWGHRAVGFLLEMDPGIDGIFCGSDQIARGVVDALRERGVKVPADVAVVGFDNWEIIAAATRPALTTVDMNLHELGRIAGTRLLAMIAGEKASGIIRLPCSLIVRDSCGVHTLGTAERRKEDQGD